MKTTNVLFLAALPILAITSGCIDNFTIHGNGISRTESRYSTDFEKVKSSGDFDVHITNGDEYEISVNAETNIQPYIETDVVGNTLDIYIRGIHNIRNTRPMEVYITTPYLKTITQSGSGIVTTDYFTAQDFKINLSGSGSIETAVDCHELEAVVSGSGSIYISGISDESQFTVSGSGRIDAYDLSTTDCKAVISGSGDILANVSRFLDANISGSGNVFYIGSPEIHTHISGSGKVIEDN